MLHWMREIIPMTKTLVQGVGYWLGSGECWVLVAGSMTVYAFHLMTIFNVNPETIFGTGLGTQDFQIQANVSAVGQDRHMLQLVCTLAYMESHSLQECSRQSSLYDWDLSYTKENIYYIKGLDIFTV